MIRSFEFDKIVSSAFAIFAGTFLICGQVAAQNLYFDPSGTIGNSGSSAGGSGSFNTSAFTNDSTGLDQLYVDGSNANFTNAAGTVTVTAPVAISTTSSAGSLFVNVNGTETFNGPGAITFNTTSGYGNQTFWNLNSPVTFNAPIVVANSSVLYQGYWQNNSAGNVTINNISFTGTDAYPAGQHFDSNTSTGSYTFTGALTGTNDGQVVDVGGVGTLTSTATVSGLNLGTDSGGTLYLQTQNLGGAGIILNTGSLLTQAAGLKISNGINAAYSTIGTATTDDATYSGTISLYGTNSLNLQAKPGSEVHITTNGIYAASTNVITINDPSALSAANAADVNNPGVVSLETVLFSNGNAETSLNHYAQSTNATVNVANGTLLVNAGTVADPVVAASIHISSATPGTPANGTTAAVAPTYTGILGGTGVIGYYNQFDRTPNGPGADTFLTPVIADGPLSTIAPGDMTKVAATTPGGTPTFASDVGTLTLAGGLTATNGLTLDFTLNGTGANSEISTLNAPVTLGGELIFNFTNIGGALSTTTPYVLIYSAPFAAAFDDSNVDYDGIVVNAPAGYIGTIGGDEINQEQVIDVTFTAVQTPEPSTYALMGLGMLALAWRVRRARCVAS